MTQRFLSISFRHLTTDYIAIRRPPLRDQPFVVATPTHGRMIITAANKLAQDNDIHIGMAIADARIILPDLEVLDDNPNLITKLLRALALWCIRYTPIVTVDPPDGLLLDIAGCTHLWGGERSYMDLILNTLTDKGYTVTGAIADTIGAAWAMARFSRQQSSITETGQHHQTLLRLPAAALRIAPETVDRLHKLGLKTIRAFADMPRQSLRIRFGNDLLLRLDQATGLIQESLLSVIPPEPYTERLPCLEPIRTAPGIEIALETLLDTLCTRLQKDGKGIRTAVFKGYRIDGKVEAISIGTHRATTNKKHLFKLFRDSIQTIEPDFGIEVFTLEAPKVDDTITTQSGLWSKATGLKHNSLSELADRITNKLGPDIVTRFLPHQHYWPERAITPTHSLDQQALDEWSVNHPRPIHVLPNPEPIEVAAPIPDYPPMLFIHKKQRYQIKKADGPERIEQEWWITNGEHRDYYAVEDEQGIRYWIFRAGHYTPKAAFQWYLHGYFA